MKPSTLARKAGGLSLHLCATSYLVLIIDDNTPLRTRKVALAGIEIDVGQPPDGAANVPTARQASHLSLIPPPLFAFGLVSVSFAFWFCACVLTPVRG